VDGWREDGRREEVVVGMGVGVDVGIGVMMLEVEDVDETTDKREEVGLVIGVTELREDEVELAVDEED